MTGRTAIGNAPVSYGAFEVTVGIDENVPSAVEVLDAVQSAGYEGIDLGPLGYLGLGKDLLEALSSRNLLLTGGYVEIDVTSDEASRKGLAELTEVCNQFDFVSEGVEKHLLPRPTVALIAPAGSPTEDKAVGSGGPSVSSASSSTSAPGVDTRRACTTSSALRSRHKSRSSGPLSPLPSRSASTRATSSHPRATRSRS